MTSLWPQIEPLLARVQKPARYIGCEDGAQRPDHDAGQVAWLLIYPDTYEIGLPNQGLQILYEILNERPTPSPSGPTPRGSTSSRAARAAGCRCSRSTATGRRGDSTCWPSTSRPSWSTPTCSTASTWPASRCGPSTPAGATRWSPPAATAPTTPSRWPTSSTSFVHRRRRGGGGGDHRGGGATGRPRAAPRAPAEQVLRRAGRGARGVRAVDVRGDLRRRAPGGGHAPLPRRARPGREAHHRRPGRLALPQAPAGPAHRGGPRPAQRRDLPGLHPGLPVLPGGHDHPPGARAPRRPGRAHGRRGPAPHRLRRGRAHLAVHRRLLAASSEIVAAIIVDPMCTGQVSVSAAEPAGRRLHRRHRQPSSRRPGAPASPSPPRPGPGGCARSSTS